MPVVRAAPDPFERVPIQAPIGTGVRAIDAFLTCGRGQRIGIFGGSGVGKSTLMGMMARGTTADLTVVALVGERGREVGEFLKLSRRSWACAVPWSSSPPPISLRCCGIRAAPSRHLDRRILLRPRQACAAGAWTRSLDSPWRSAKSDWPPANRPPPKATRLRCSLCSPG